MRVEAPPSVAMEGCATERLFENKGLSNREPELKVEEIGLRSDTVA